MILCYALGRFGDTKPTKYQIFYKLRKVSYDKTANTARKYLNELVEYKILAIIKNGNTKGYIAPANIREVLERR